MTRCLLFPGSFDPFTLGHLDLARRALELGEHLYIAVLDNPAKESCFSTPERCALIESCFATESRVTVLAWDNSLASLYNKLAVTAVVRGVRDWGDLAFEQKLDRINRDFAPAYESILLCCKAELAHISSSLVREIASLGGAYEQYVPKQCHELLGKRWSRQVPTCEEE